MKFTKMHGLGNDYVYVNCFKETVKDPVAMAIAVSDRHFGVGSDGLILIKPSEIADFEMDMYNLDGSRGKMCGNGIRCVAKYVYDYGLTDQTKISVATGSGIKYLELTVENGKTKAVKVDMGAPILGPEQIPVDVAKIPEAEAENTSDCCMVSTAEAAICCDAGMNKQDMLVGRKICIGDAVYEATCVSMGNPHCIVPVEDPGKLDLTTIGPMFENHPMFPDRVNTEFIHVIDRTHVRMRVWERGSGETMACGTGACAVAVACILNGWTEDTVTVHLLGGDLLITWDKEKNTVFMTGPATVVFDGEWPEA